MYYFTGVTLTRLIDTGLHSSHTTYGFFSVLHFRVFFILSIGQVVSQYQTERICRLVKCSVEIFPDYSYFGFTFISGNVSSTVFTISFFFFFFFFDGQTWANSVDPDQTPQNAASDQGLHCLTLIQQF